MLTLKVLTLKAGGMLQVLKVLNTIKVLDKVLKLNARGMLQVLKVLKVLTLKAYGALHKVLKVLKVIKALHKVLKVLKVLTLKACCMHKLRLKMQTLVVRKIQIPAGLEVLTIHYESVIVYLKEKYASKRL